MNIRSNTSRAALLSLLAGVAAADDLTLVSKVTEDGKDAERAKKLEAAKAAEAKDLAAFQERVNAAIDRGVAWLKTKQKSTTGGFPARNSCSAISTSGPAAWPRTSSPRNSRASTSIRSFAAGERIPASSRSCTSTTSTSKGPLKCGG